MSGPGTILPVQSIRGRTIGKACFFHRDLQIGSPDSCLRSPTFSAHHFHGLLRSGYIHACNGNRNGVQRDLFSLFNDFGGQILIFQFRSIFS